MACVAVAYSQNTQLMLSNAWEPPLLTAEDMYYLFEISNFYLNILIIQP